LRLNKKGVEKKTRVKNNKETAPPTKTSFKRSKQNGGQMQMKLGLFFIILYRREWLERA